MIPESQEPPHPLQHPGLAHRWVRGSACLGLHQAQPHLNAKAAPLLLMPRVCRACLLGRPAPCLAPSSKAVGQLGVEEEPCLWLPLVPYCPGWAASQGSPALGSFLREGVPFPTLPISTFLLLPPCCAGLLATPTMALPESGRGPAPFSSAGFGVQQAVFKFWLHLHQSLLFSKYQLCHL